MVKNDPEPSRRHGIPRVPPFSGSFSVSAHTHFFTTSVAQERDPKAAEVFDRHPCPRTISSIHCAGTLSCPLFVPPYGCVQKLQASGTFVSCVAPRGAGTNLNGSDAAAWWFVCRHLRRTKRHEVDFEWFNDSTEHPSSAPRANSRRIDQKSQ